jgi:5'-nucleotidase
MGVRQDSTVTNSKPLILLTNDDGIASPGLLAAAQAVCDLGELLIVAPVTQQTGMGRGGPPILEGVMTIHTLRVGCEDVAIYSINGSPAQAVVYGALAVAPRKPDLVISGINHGENVGTSVTVSGTVGAALQAAELGILGLAMSFEVPPAYYFNHGDHLEWSAPAHFTRYFAQALLAVQLPGDVDVIKVDVPASARPDTPWRITRQSRQPYWQPVLPQQRQQAGALLALDFRIEIDWATLEADSDIYAIARDRVVAVVPLSQDLTSRTDLSALENSLRQGSE